MWMNKLACCQCYVSVLLNILLFSVLWMPSSPCNSINAGSARPLVVNVGALFAFDSTIGRVAKSAMELAVGNVNTDCNLLGGTKLELTMMDSNCTAFVGASAALELLKKDLVAIIGPQSSVLSHIVSHLAKELQIPLLSFAATDPTLASHEYPYFIRMAHSDSSQMSAIAAIVGYYGWRQVGAVYVDDDNGRNGVSALEEALRNVGAKITHKTAVTPHISQNEMGNILANLGLVEARVFVVHMNSDAGLNLFSKAKKMGMLRRGYVWIVTDWLTSVLDSTGLATEDMDSLQGLIGLRRQIPNSGMYYEEFAREWKRLQRAHMVDVSLNVFGLYAYDSILMIAHSINTFLNQGGNFSFADQNTLSDKSGINTSELAALKVFKGGAKLRQIILETNFSGVSGPVKLDENRGLVGSAFAIINIAGTGIRSIGYWSDSNGLSVTPPEYSTTIKHKHNHRRSLDDDELHNVIWPGESKQVPRGWTFPNNGRELLIGVPRKIGFEEFVSTQNGSRNTPIPRGFCIDVFFAAMNLLPYAVPRTFIYYGTRDSQPSYDELVEQVALQKLDAVVGDIAIVAKRTKIVDFTQPYVKSGLVVVAPVKGISSNAWAFLQPFTLEMWCTTGAFFVFIGFVVWVLEHRSNPEFRGLPREQVMTVLWFSFSTMFFAHRENTVSILGRVVVIIWLFAVLIINSSYTASLTTILTVEQLSPTIQGIDSLVSTNSSIGYQKGSYVADYLSQQFNISKDRFVPLSSPDNYDEALSLGPNEGGVAAVVDELPYIESFLSTRCRFAIVGRAFTKSGWGFVFPKHSELAVDMSTAILALSESGELQRIHDKWLKIDECSRGVRAIQSNQFGLERFRDLFLLTGGVCLAALFAFFVRMIYQFTRCADPSIEESPAKSQPFRLKSAMVLRSFATFVNEREDNEKERGLQRKRADMEMDPESELSQPQSTPI